MTKKHLSIAGLVIAGGSLGLELIALDGLKKQTIEKTAHIGIAIGLGLIAIGIFKKD